MFAKNNMSHSFIDYPSSGPNQGLVKDISPAALSGTSAEAILGSARRLYDLSQRIPIPVAQSPDAILHPAPPTVSTIDTDTSHSAISNSVLPPSNAAFVFTRGGPTFGNDGWNLQYAIQNNISSNGTLSNLDMTFCTDAPVVEIFSRQNGYYRILVDDMDVSGTVYGASSGNNPMFQTITFTGRAPRKICISATGGGIWHCGVKIGRKDSVWRPPVSPMVRAIIVGDSITEPTISSGGGPTYNGWANRFGRRLGWDVWASGSGGTGYTTTGGISGRFKLGDRFANDVAAWSPAVLGIAMGINDITNVNSNGIGYLQAELDLLTPLIAAISSLREVVIWGPWRDTNASFANPSQNPSYASIFTALQAWASTNSSLRTPWRFIDNSNWLTGKGRTNGLTNDGNGDIWMGDNGPHPTLAGHLGYADYSAAEYLRLRSV